VSIREARADEVNAIREFWRSAGLRVRDAETAEAIAALAARADAWLLVAEVDGTLAGTLIASWDGWRGHFYRLAVAPDHRRRGIGLALVRAGEERLRAAGARRLVAIVVLDDPNAVGFWTSAGYPQQTEVGRFLKTI
jgi:ribosomal protein S18 acetylase RimI-like enzyme